jgi:hypothetical protein
VFRPNLGTAIGHGLGTRARSHQSTYGGGDERYAASREPNSGAIARSRTAASCHVQRLSSQFSGMLSDVGRSPEIRIVHLKSEGRRFDPAPDHSEIFTLHRAPCSHLRLTFSRPR